MATAVVAFNGTRLNDADANTGWGNYNVGGGAPASEFPLAYQVTSGTTTGAVNKKVNATTGKEGVDYNGSAVDYTAAANRLLFLKIYVSDSFDLATVWGVEFSMGSADQSNFHQYNIAGSGANLSVYDQYPPQGGYLITAIDCTIDTWAETVDSGGTTDQTAIIWYGLGADFVNGTAKSENVAFDSIDYGTGLTITAGDGASTEGNFLDFVAADQDTKTARWGVVTGSGDVVRGHGILTIGTASVTEFLDTTSIVLFADGYHSAGLVGTAVGLSHASSIIQIDCTIIGEGTRNASATNDTRPDFIVTGTTGTFSCAANLRNHRNITLTSASPLDGADIECELLTQASADIENCTIRTNALTSVACLQDPTFGTTTDLNNTDFIQTGAGHAIELSTVDGTFTFTGLTFTGYGADTTDDAALDITAASGTTTINYSGTAPTYKSAGATVSLVVSVPVSFEAVDKTDAAIASVLVTAYLVSDDTEVINTTTNGSGIASTTFGGTTPADIYYRYRKSSSGATKYVNLSGFGTIESSTGVTIKRSMSEDTIADPSV